MYTLESEGLGKGALEKKIKSLQYVLSQEAIVGRPTKLQVVRDEKLREYLTDRVQKKEGLWVFQGHLSLIFITTQLDSEEYVTN